MASEINEERVEQNEFNKKYRTNRVGPASGPLATLLLGFSLRFSDSDFTIEMLEQRSGLSQIFLEKLHDETIDVQCRDLHFVGRIERDDGGTLKRKSLGFQLRRLVRVLEGP